MTRNEIGRLFSSQIYYEDLMDEKLDDEMMDKSADLGLKSQNADNCVFSRLSVTVDLQP